jgi:hypothetical protein
LNLPYQRVAVRRRRSQQPRSVIDRASSASRPKTWSAFHSSTVVYDLRFFADDTDGSAAIAFSLKH